MAMAPQQILIAAEFKATYQVAPFQANTGHQSVTDRYGHLCDDGDGGVVVH